jgi:hypothetical protein
LIFFFTYRIFLWYFVPPVLVRLSTRIFPLPGLIDVAHCYTTDYASSVCLLLSVSCDYSCKKNIDYKSDYKIDKYIFRYFKPSENLKFNLLLPTIHVFCGFL